MKSLKELYRIGQGPSSSHTMGPRRAAEKYLATHSDAPRFKVTLYGSLAATGKGHLTDWAIYSVLGKEGTTPDKLSIDFTCTLTPWEDITGSLSTDLEQ